MSDPETVRQVGPELAPGVVCVVCNLCGADDAKPLFMSCDLHLGGQQRFGMVRCRSCGLTYLSPRPAKESVADFYPVNYAVFREDGWSVAVRFRRLLLRRKASRISRLALPGGRALEIGCGQGELLVALRDRGLRVEGLDLSPHAVRIASRSGIRVVQGTILTTAFDEGAYDIIVMAHVLEHTPDAQATLRRVHALLRPKGRLYIEVPNAGSIEAHLLGRYWGGWDIPRHMYGFSPATLAMLVRHAGLSTERMGFIASPVNAAWGILNLLRSATPLAPLLRNGGERAVRVMAKLLLMPYCVCAKAAGQAGSFFAVCQRP